MAPNELGFNKVGGMHPHGSSLSWFLVATATLLSCLGVGRAIASDAPPPLSSPLHAALMPGELVLNVTALTPPPGRYELRLLVADTLELETAPDIRFPGAIYLPPNPAIPPPALPGQLVMFRHRNAVNAPWKLVMAFPAGATGTWQLNGSFAPLTGDIQPEVIVPVEALLSGENSLLLNSADTTLPQLTYRRDLNDVGAREGQSVTTGLAAAEANVELWRTAPGASAAEKIATARVSRTASPLAITPTALDPASPLTDRAYLVTAAQAVAQNLLRSRVATSRPGFSGGFNLVYDATNELWRAPHWVWSWGPAVKFLLKLDRQLPAETSAPRAAYREAALAAGLRSLDFVQTKTDHPARGIAAVRWALSPETPQGLIEYFSTADSLFLAGWAWMPLYQATHHRPFLAHTQGLEAAAVRLMDAYPVVPQDYVEERQRWTPHTLDESIFGMIGFTELYAATQNPTVKANGVRFIESHLEHMGQPHGFLDRGWDRATGKAFWDADVKGHLWVLLGYLDAYRLNGDTRYLDLAKTLGDKIAASQGTDGAWTDAFHVPTAEDPRNDRAIAMGAWMFYELHRLSGDALYLVTARRALEWCLRRQDFSANLDLFGAIPNQSGMAHLAERRMTILYTTEFFGLALLAELELPRP